MSDETLSSSIAEPAYSTGEAYEPLTGRWSRLVAPSFVDWLDVPAGGRWLDVGCGTGALIQTILDTQRPAEIIGIDPNSPFIAYARRRIDDNRVRFEVGDARDLPVPSMQFHSVVAGLVLNHIPDPGKEKAVREMRRTARKGGVVAGYVWDYPAGLMPRVRFWETATARDPAAAEFDERGRYPICTREGLEALFRRAGLSCIETRLFEIEARFASFDDYWSPFLAGAGLASRYVLSLSDEGKAALRDDLQRALPVNADDSIVLPMRAIGVQGLA